MILVLTTTLDDNPPIPNLSLIRKPVVNRFEIPLKHL